MNSDVECPLCTQIGFQSVDALRIALVSAASRNLTCPVCSASLTGLDKLTVHLFSHTLPQHELHNVGQRTTINNGTLNMDTPVTPPLLSKSITLTPQEPTKKVDFTSPCTIPLQNFENFQSEAICNKASETTSVLNQDLSSLLCWLPLTCFPDKLSNSAFSNIGSVHCDLLNNRTPLQSQQNDGKVDTRQILGTAESNEVNKDAPFIIVTLPSLQDMKKQISHSNNCNTQELSLSDVSSLSGKLLMLDCSGNSQCNNNVSVNNLSETSSVQISISDQSSSHTTSVNMIPANQNPSLSNREVTNTATSFNMKDDVIKHNKQSAEEESLKSTSDVFRCTLCFSQFTDSNILSLHQQLVHEGSNSLQSRLTSPSKESTTNQEENTTENKEEEIFQCHLCSKTFHMQGSLMVHLRVAHTTPTMVGLASRIKGSISDPSAASTLSIPGSVTAKNAKTADNKQWECTDCGKFFTTKYFLKKHKRLHTGEMPYTCPTCGKSFTFQQSYHKHLLYHSDEKPHTCTECGRSFKELSTLHNHQRIHTGEKPWACETCGKCFRQRVSYLVHRRIHTGAMPYCCTVCNKSFRYKVSQRTHKCVPQPTSASTGQPGDLLQRLLFDQPEETTTTQNQEREQVKLEKMTHEQEQTQYIQQNQPEEVQSNPRIPQSKQQGSAEETQLLYSSLNSDKSIFPQSMEANSSDFNLHNFQLQQALSKIQTQPLSQSNVALQNVPMSLKDDLKQNAVMNSSWSADERSSPGQNTVLNTSSVVVTVNDKEMISAAGLQVLEKEKYAHEFPTHPSVNTNAPCPDAVKVSDTAMSTPFGPDFMSASTQNPSSNASINNDPFHWEVSLDIPSHDASQEAMDSLQSLLFGSPSTEL